MNYTIVSWDGHNINDGVTYRAAEDNSFYSQAKGSISELNRSDAPPTITKKMMASKTLSFTIQTIDRTPDGVSDGMTEINNWFDTFDTELRQLIISDENSVQWYVNAMVDEMPQLSAKGFIIKLRVPDPIWRTVESDTLTWNITASGQTNDFTFVGNRPITPIITITPEEAKGSGTKQELYYIYRNAMPQNLVSTGISNPLSLALDITNLGIDGETGLDTDTIIGAGDMQADGDDIILTEDNSPVSRWLNGINTSATQIWGNTEFEEGLVQGVGGDTTLYSSIDGSSAVTNIVIQKAGGSFNQGTDNYFSQRKHKAIIIGTEVFTYETANANRNFVTLTSPSVTDMRGKYGTAKAAHSPGDYIYHAKVFKVSYGNLAATLSQDETKKPLIDLTSTNDVWTQELFYDSAGLRTCGLIPYVTTAKGTNTNFYTDTEGASVDPAEAAGAKISAYQSGSAWRGQTAQLGWIIGHPCGLDTITITGKKYRLSTDWPAMGLYYRHTGKNGITSTTTFYTEDTPSTADTWEALATHEDVAIGKYQCLFEINGNIAATVVDGVGDNAAMEIGTLERVIDTTYLPILVTKTIVASAVDIFEFSPVITNNTTGDKLEFNSFMMEVGESIIIDCAKKTVTYSKTGEDISSYLKSPQRRSWFDMRTGDEIQYDDDGTNDLTFEIDYVGRMA